MILRIIDRERPMGFERAAKGAFPPSDESGGAPQCYSLAFRKDPISGEEHIGPEDYEQRLPAVRRNFERAQRYFYPDAYAWENIRDLFESPQ